MSVQDTPQAIIQKAADQITTGNRTEYILRTKLGEFAVRLDDTTTANVTYVGKAAIGSATSSEVWQIKKIDETSGLVITWADSDAQFDNIWDNRASITYG